MTLGLNTAFNDGSGQFMPVIKYNAELGRLYQTDRVQGANGFESREYELPVGTEFAVDFGTIEIGWMLFATRTAPSFATAPLGMLEPERPTPDHREGFRVRIWSRALGIREWASSAKTLLGPMDELHNAYERAAEAQQGLVPVIRFTGAMPVETKNTRGRRLTYRPSFEIFTWTPRIAQLGERTVPIPDPNKRMRTVPQPQVQPAASIPPTMPVQAAQPTGYVQSPAWGSGAAAANQAAPPVPSQTWTQQQPTAPARPIEDWSAHQPQQPFQQQVGPQSFGASAPRSMSDIAAAAQSPRVVPQQAPTWGPADTTIDDDIPF